MNTTTINNFDMDLSLANELELKLDDIEIETIEDSVEYKVGDNTTGSEELSIDALSYYMNRIANSTPLSKEEERELGLRIQKGDKTAIQTLVNANLKFVIKVAFKFRSTGLPMSDIISQGNLGLLEAAKRFDPSKDVKFISYAVWWIRQYIVQGIAEQSGTVKLPVKQATNLFRINNAKEYLNAENGKEATAQEVADYLKLSENDVTDILRVSKQALSLENSVKDGEGKTFLDYMEDKRESVEETLIKSDLHKLVASMIDDLSPREKSIINLRFGFENDETHTLEEVGKKFGVSRERVRQIENKVLEKLKKKAQKNGLEVYRAC